MPSDTGATGFSEISYEVQGHTAVITLDRPDHLNAFTAQMLVEMLEAFDLVDADDAVRAVIVTGRGRAYCAGADLSMAAGGAAFDADAASGGTVARVPRDGGGLLTLRIFRCTKPVIAAINGPAVGVGITMTLPMDLRLAARGAKIGFVFAGRGIVPEAASSWFLPRLVGPQRALEWCYTARVFPAEDAVGTGLLRSVHEPDELLGAAHALADEIAARAAPVSVSLTRQMLWRMLGASHPMEAHRVDSRAIYELGRAPDAYEGVTAFFEKRDPTWTMRPSTDTPEVQPWWEEPEFR
jgi:enoyl-CoA hydratase/carnithine racemase